jgi:hypothetical protein
MSSKGTQTRERIVARAATVFSERGFFGSSMTDLLAVADRYAAALAGRTTAVDRLLAVVDVIRSLVDSPVLPGGCPILNTAIESDDTMPALRDRARAAMTGWQKLIGSTVRDGVAAGELRTDADPYVVATVVTATMEGAVFLSKLYDDPVHMRRAVQHVESYVRGLVA